jgi:hypothetical protein
MPVFAASAGLRDTLEANGGMGRVQALMRSEVLGAMSLPAGQVRVCCLRRAAVQNDSG